MSEWDVFLAIASVVGLAAVILPPVTKLNSAITRLTVTVEVLAQNLVKLEAQNHKSHEALREGLKEHGRLLAGHETRIGKLENSKQQEDKYA